MSELRRLAKQQSKKYRLKAKQKRNEADSWDRKADDIDKEIAEGDKK